MFFSVIISYQKADFNTAKFQLLQSLIKFDIMVTDVKNKTGVDITLSFKDIKFIGTFRDYQQRVLDNADKYIKDGKINIVAAPGSGKTVLGLELIRRLQSPCIVLSPTTAIKEQWGKRFKDLFLEKKDDFENLYSNDLHDVKLLNSVTYQALYTAIEKVSETDEDGSGDLSDIDIFEKMKECGIKTICLDEAHHLKNEWQKALEKFISGLPKGVRIISLTATPPYDSDGSEWERYMAVCGDIDEEIFVPELVGQKTLCPHQDYVYFNFPTGEELEVFKEHKQNAHEAVVALKSLEVMRKVANLLNCERDYGKLYAHAKENIALMVLLNHYGFLISGKLIKLLTLSKKLPKFKMEYAQEAVSYLLTCDYTTKEEKEQITDVLKEHSVFEKKKPTLTLNEKIKRSLISSVGKLDSITRIAKSEFKAMGKNLRLLVLTDYIRKESLTKISSKEKFDSVNIVSIFESLRKELPELKIGVLSGTLVILPNSFDLIEIKHKSTPIEGTDYSVIDFAGAKNNIAVDYVGKLFETGKLQALVGTKSLLGEGWDSPCINSLILASFVGSFVLSNQMRGRAIRIDKNNPDKVSGIWHLVTVEPEYIFKDKIGDKINGYLTYDSSTLTSYDFEILKRRFDSFMGPHYETGVIESGIDRLSAIKAPYTETGINKINEEMLTLSADRDDIREKWKNEVEGQSFRVEQVTEIPKEKRVPVFTFFNILPLAILGALVAFTLTKLAISGVSIVIAVILIICLYLASIKLIIHINPSKSFKTLGKAVYKTLRDCGLISEGAKVHSEEAGAFVVTLSLRNASTHDQNIFNLAMKELLSPIVNPRYIIIKNNKLKLFGEYNYKLSFACPTVIGKKKENVQVLADRLKSTGNLVPIYAHSENGRELIIKCRYNSYISHNQKQIDKKYTVSHYE